MPKSSIFSVLLMGALIVSPVVSAFNLPVKNASADAPISLSSVVGLSSSSSADSLSSLQFDSLISSVSSMLSSSLVSSSSAVSSSLESSTAVSSSIVQTSLPATAIKGIKSFAQSEVKPVKLNPASTVWWKEVDTFSGGNGLDNGVDAMNVSIQEKLATLCPGIYNPTTKIINDANLSNCAAINNLPIQKIGVIDSGVNATADMLPFMDQANSWKYFTSVNNASCTATSPLLFATAQGSNNTTNYYCKEKGTQTDTDYHGTAAAYVSIQMFKSSLLKNKIKIVPVSLQTLDTINISDSIDQLTADGIKIINLSLGTPYNINYMQTAVNDAAAAGVTLYAASGNCAVYSASNCEYDGVPGATIPQEANNAPNYPAAYANATMVGSSTYSDNNVASIARAGYSNFVTSLRTKFITAPVGNNGIVLPCFYQCPNGVTNYGYLGTSFAAPQASGLNGLVDRFASFMKLNLGQVNEKVLVSTTTPESYINGNTTDLLTAGNDLETGNGLINTFKINNAITAQLQTMNVPVSSVTASSLPSSITATSSLPNISQNQTAIVTGYSFANPNVTLCVYGPGQTSSLAYAITSGQFNLPVNPISSGSFYTLYTQSAANSCTAGTRIGSVVDFIAYPRHTTTVPVNFAANVGLNSNGTPVVANQSPAFTGNNGSNVFPVCMGTTGSFTITFTDPNGDLLQAASNTLPSGITVSSNASGNTLVYTVYPDASITSAVGVRDFTLTAQEVSNSYQSGVGAQVSQLFSLNVINCNPPASSAQVVTPISSAIIISSTNVQSSIISSSSVQTAPASSSQVSSSSQTVSSSSAPLSSASISNSSQSSTTVNPTNSGGGVISIIVSAIQNVINSLTGNNANTNGNLNPNSSTNSVSSNAAQSSVNADEKIKIPATTVPLKNSEDASFAGLVNNPNGSSNANEFGIKENGVKSPEVQVETQSDFGIKEQGIKTPTNQQTSSNISSNIKDETCRKGYQYYTACGDTSVCKKGITEKGISNVVEQNAECVILQPSCDKGIQEKGLSNKANSECVIAKPECKKGIKEKGLSNKSATDAECGGANQECKKGWDGSVKGGSIAQGCISPIGTNPQSDINSGNDLGKYIPIVVIALVGTLGALAVNGWVQKMGLQKAISAGAQMLGGAAPQSAAKHAINTKGAGTSNGKVSVQDLHFSKKYDNASPYIMSKGTPQDLHFNSDLDKASPVIHNKVSMQDFHITEATDASSVLIGGASSASYAANEFVASDTSNGTPDISAKGTPQDMHFSAKGVVSGAAGMLGGAFPGSAAKHAINTKGAGTATGITDSMTKGGVQELLGNNCPGGGNRVVNIKGAEHAINTKGAGSSTNGKVSMQDFHITETPDASNAKHAINTKGAGTNVGRSEEILKRNDTSGWNQMSNK